MKVIEWIEVLKSGKYDQTRGGLRNSFGDGSGRVAYCCLGVAEVECGIRFGFGLIKDDDEYGNVGMPGPEALARMGELGKWLQELVDEDGDLTQRMDHFACMNDGGKSFTEIAEVASAMYDKGE